METFSLQLKLQLYKGQGGFNSDFSCNDLIVCEENPKKDFCLGDLEITGFLEPYKQGPVFTEVTSHQSRNNRWQGE